MTSRDHPDVYDAVTSDQPLEAPTNLDSITTPSNATQNAHRSSSEGTLPGETGEGLNEKHDSSQGQENSDEQNDSSQKEEEEQQVGPPLPVGFLHKSLATVRKQVLIRWSRTVLILCMFILTVLSLYWAVLFRVYQNMSSLKVAVVDFDSRFPPYENVQPLLGPLVTQATEKQSLVYGTLGFETQSPAMYNNDPIAVRQAVYDEHIWAAIIINNNATAMLQEAVRIGNQSYDPLGAAQIIYETARDQDSYYDYILPQLYALEIEITAMFGEQWVKQVLSNTSLSATTYSRAPQALNPGIGFSTFDLRPFNPAQATPAVTIGLIYLIIIAFFSFAFFLPIYTQFVIPQGHPPMHFWELILWRLFATIAAYFFMSLAYSLVSLAFQIPFSNTFPHNDTSVARNPNAYGHGSFVVYWMLNWVGMTALGLASENVTMIIGQPWTAMWLIFWVITNVSTSFYAIPLSPGFFHYGYAWPLYHVVYASRTILFDTHSRIGLNFGVLFTWVAIGIALFPFCCIYMRWKANKEMARKVHRPIIRYLVDG